MVAETKEMHTCEVCEITDEDVKEYPTHKNGYETTEYLCTDINPCLDRRDANIRAYWRGRAEIEKKHPHLFED